jgi:hypothetical protein
MFFVVSSVYHVVLFQFIDSDTHGRYFIPFLIFFVPVLAVLFEKAKELSLSSGVFALIMLITVVILGQGALNFQRIARSVVNRIRNGYVNYLREHNLHFGFATFWNANVTTELTNGVVEITSLETERTNGPVKIREDKLLYSNRLEPVKYDDPLYYQGESFLLFSQEEWDGVKNTEMFTAKLPVYEDSNFVIITYPSAQVIHKTLFSQESLNGS